MDNEPVKLYKLLDADGVVREYPVKGTLGGYRRGKEKYYGRLDRWSARKFIAEGKYVKFRVFFADEATAVAAGHRPCSNCMRAEYKAWKMRTTRRA